MNLSTNILRYVLEVSKVGSISKAAENLFISQPYLSNSIKTFEKDLGFRIFIREARGVKLTDEGASFVRHAQDIVSRIESLEERYFYDEHESLQLRVSITRSYQIVSRLIDYINYNHMKEHVLVRIKETNPFQVIKDVSERVSDFGTLHYYDVQQDYFRELFKRYGLEYDEDYKQKYLLCMSKDNPIAGNEVIEKEMLSNQMVVLYGDYEAPDISYEYVSEFSEIVFSKKKIYVYDRATALDIVNHSPMTYMWITGLHEDTLKQHNLVLRECADVNVHNIGSRVYYSKESLPKAAKDILKTLDNIDWSPNIKEIM